MLKINKFKFCFGILMVLALLLYNLNCIVLLKTFENCFLTLLLDIHIVNVFL